MCTNARLCKSCQNAMVHLVCPSPFKCCHLPWSTPYSLYPIFQEWLYFGERLSRSLICPNQLQLNGIAIFDCPKQFDQNFKHSIHVPDKDFPFSFGDERFNLIL
jgi:hypothetical protein